jgi:hypothetical protein
LIGRFINNLENRGAKRGNYELSSKIEIES